MLNFHDAPFELDEKDPRGVFAQRTTGSASDRRVHNEVLRVCGGSRSVAVAVWKMDWPVRGIATGTTFRSLVAKTLAPSVQQGC